MTGPASVAGMIGFIEETRLEFERKHDFLMRIAPKLASPVAKREIDARWGEVLNTADECNVPRASLIVLAALSTLANPSGYCAAKKLLKFKYNYDAGDVYNSLSDIRSLEILIRCHAAFPEFHTQFCTEDKNLALFWVGSGVRGIEADGSYTVAPHEAILPTPYGERWAEALEAT